MKRPGTIQAVIRKYHTPTIPVDIIREFDENGKKFYEVEQKNGERKVVEANKIVFNKIWAIRK